MTATDELRRLLDERGVEYEGNKDVTRFFGHDGFEVVMQEDIDGKLDCLTPLYLTPAQAVEATLGLGTCSLVREYFGQSGNWYRLVCSECHHIIYDGWQEKPRYCPFCGRRVNA